MKSFILTLFFLVLFLLSGKAYYFRSYQVEDGLSHNSVWAVMQDSRGFVWFGTNDGLNRFDGKTFKIYKRHPGDSNSIGNSFIHCLKEDSQGRFLVGTKQGLYRFDTDYEKFYPVDLGGAVSINSIMEDPDGSIWLACHGQGLYVLNSDLTVKKHYIDDHKKDCLPSNHIWAIVADYYGGIWLGSVGDGLIHFNPQEEKFIKYINDDEFGVKDKIIYSLYCDVDNNLWIGTSGDGLAKYSFRTRKVTHYDNPKILNIKSIIEFSDHELIMGSDKGLVKFDRTSETFDLINNDSSFDNLTDNSIFSIMRDSEGSFWIGTYFGGVNYFSPTINSFAYYYNSPENQSKKNIISSFAENGNGKIWVGTHNDGLFLFNSKNAKFEKQIYNIGYHDVQNLLLDNGKLYVSLYGKGIRVLNVENGMIKGSVDLKQQPPGSVTSIFKTSKGVIMFCSEDGVRYLEPLSDEIKRLDYLAGKPVKSIIEDYNGSLWFATHANGLVRVAANGKQEWFVNDPKNSASLISNNVNCVFQDSKFRIWIGTEGEGLTLFNHKNNTFETVFNENSGFPSNIIYSILDDADGNIWVSTAGGLVKIDTDLKSVRTFGYIGDIQRIRYNPNCALRASDNKLYFGGTNGFIAFNPKEITINISQPAIEITGFQIAGKEVIPGGKLSPLNMPINKTEKIILKHDQSTFSFDFVALSFLSPSQNEYTYILEGFDKEWHLGNNNKATYMNIPAGDYVFKVKGANNDGIWSELAIIKIKVKPSFWISPLMIIIYTLMVLGIVTYLMLQYNRRMETKNQEKLYKYQTAKEKEIYESKINFFTDIAHEIRTPLSLIVAPLENIIVSGDGNKQTKSNLEVIEKNANRLLQLVNQLLDFRKIEEDMFHFNFRKQNVTKIVRNVYNQYNRNVNLTGIEMNFSAEENDIECRVDAEALYKIVSNLISNATKYAETKIDIQLKSTAHNLLISVYDDGIGIEDTYLQKIFEPFFQVHDKNNGMKAGSGLGLSLSQSLAEKHGGKITIQSEYGKGSLFTLTIPLTGEESGVVEDETESMKTEIHENECQGSQEITSRILVVEDNAELRSFLVNSLSEIYTVFEAENGVKALEMVENESIDIIISDIIMPEMNGLELCDKLKIDPAYSHIPIILLSAKTDTSTKIDGLKKGADVYIEKPFSIEQLKAQVNSIIENRNHMRDNFRKSPLQYFRQHRENNENGEFIEKLNAIIIENMSDEKFSIDNLSEQFFMSRSSFHKKIKSIAGMTPNDYIKLLRLNKSAEMLSSGKYKINEVCYLVGFNTPSYFSKCFFEQFGKLPKEFVNVNNE